jgi:hypothetical protein
MAVAAATPVTDGFGLALSTNNEAAAHYRRAVVELLSNAPGARSSFARAVQADRAFALGHAGAAVVAATSGDADAAAQHLRHAVLAVPGATPRERQHVTTLVAAFTRDGPEAVALARRHLTEFSADAVIVHVVGIMTVGSGDQFVRGELRRLIANLLPVLARAGSRSRQRRVSDAAHAAAMPADPENVIHQLAVGGATAIAEIVERARTSDDVTTLVAAALFAADPTDLLARAAAVARTTRDRQVVAIAGAHLDGDTDRVDALARDHLADHPSSVVVAWITTNPHPRTSNRKDLT